MRGPFATLCVHDQYAHLGTNLGDRVLEVTPSGQVVFQQGAINMPGNGFNQLNGPYDAKVIGDFTGLTPPFGLRDPR